MECICLLDKHHFKLLTITLSSCHPGHSHLGHPGGSRLLTVTVNRRHKSSHGWVDEWTDCTRTGRGSALQTSANDSHRRAKADGITQTPPNPRLQSVETVKLHGFLLQYVMNTNMPYLCLTIKALAFISGAKEDLKGFLYGLRSWYGWRWKGHIVMFCCRCWSFSCTLTHLLWIKVFLALYLPVSALFFLSRAVSISSFSSFLFSLFHDQL